MSLLLDVAIQRQFEIKSLDNPVSIDGLFALFSWTSAVDDEMM